MQETPSAERPTSVEAQTAPRKRVRLYDAGGAAVGIGVAVFALASPLLAENISVDPSTVMGGGGLTMGGILIHAIWRYLKRSEKIQELNEELVKEQLNAIREEKTHRAAERSHWNMVENRLENQTKALDRLDTGRYTPVGGIPLEPGVPR